MKISVGKNYEGTSNSFYIPDGEYEFQILGCKTTKGSVNMTLGMSNKQRCFKRFFLLDKKGVTNEKSMRELADFITTAMQIEEEDVEVDVNDCIGYYIRATIKNATYEDKETGVTKPTYYVNKPTRCNGFSDGTPSLMGKNQVAESTPEEVEEETVEVEEVEQTSMDFDSFFS